MSLETRHHHFTTMLQALKEPNLNALRTYWEGLRRQAIGQGNGDYMRFCDERLRILELELAKRGVPR